MKHGNADINNSLLLIHFTNKSAVTEENTVVNTKTHSPLAHHQKLAWCVEMWQAWLDITIFIYLGINGLMESGRDILFLANWKCCCMHTQYTCTHGHSNIIRRAGVFDWQLALREWNRRCHWRLQTSRTQTLNRWGLCCSYRGSADLIQGFEKPLDYREGETVKERWLIQIANTEERCAHVLTGMQTECLHCYSTVGCCRLRLRDRLGSCLFSHRNSMAESLRACELWHPSL